MQWSDATRPPAPGQLRQFTLLWLLVWGGLAAWRLAAGTLGAGIGPALVPLAAVGLVGLALPALMRWIYTAWMVAVFPIGWAVSTLVLAGLYFLVFTPLALWFRAVGRDHLSLRRGAGGSYWRSRRPPRGAGGYLRQS